MIIKRDYYLDKILPFLEKPIIKVITGMRRVGKSTLVKHIVEELRDRGIPEGNIFYINKEILTWDHIRDYQHLYREVKEYFTGKAGRRWIIIDEIQEIEAWEKAVTSFLAEELGDIIITGSNAHLLSSDLATLLTGRYIEFPLYPLGFAEFLQFADPVGTKKERERDVLFSRYLRYGGMPGIHMLDPVDEQVFHYLQSLLDTIILKDVVKRHALRDVSVLERILAFLFDNCSNLVSAKSIADYFKAQKIKISTDTVISYISHLTGAFLLHKSERFDLKGNRHLEFHHKLYIADHGLRAALFGYRNEDIGKLLENCVYLELLRRGYTVKTGILDSREVDFVAEKEGKRIYIQVCYLLQDPSTVDREFGNLEKIDDNYPKLVLSMDRFFPEERKGILHRYIVDFLLE